MRADPVFQRKLVKDRIFQKLGDCLEKMGELKTEGQNVEVIEEIQADVICTFVELTSNPKYAKKINLLSSETSIGKQIEKCIANSAQNPVIAQSGITVIKQCLEATDPKKLLKHTSEMDVICQTISSQQLLMPKITCI